MTRAAAVFVALVVGAHLLAPHSVTAEDASQRNVGPGAGADPSGSELFRRAYAVFSHPRCSNCHPQGDRPWWDIAKRRVHGMNVQRGREEQDGAYGLPGMECATCHQDRNGEVAGSAPGAHRWRLAPKSMGWGGKSVAEVCKQIKGEQPPEKVIEHIVGKGNEGPDPLVAWAWKPGPDRESAPGTFDDFIKIMKMWAARNGECPSD